MQNRDEDPDGVSSYIVIVNRIERNFKSLLVYCAVQYDCMTVRSMSLVKIDVKLFNRK